MWLAFDLARWVHQLPYHRRASQSQRPRVEQFFGWAKTVGATRKLRFVGAAANRLWFEVTAAAYNLVRLATLSRAAAT